MKKKRIIAICAVCVILGVAAVLVLTGNRGNISNVNRVVGYSALYDENSINEAFDVIEKKFAKDFEGCTLTELRYDEDVENKFAEEIEKYHKENNQELIVVLSFSVSKNDNISPDILSSLLLSYSAYIYIDARAIIKNIDIINNALYIFFFLFSSGVTYIFSVTKI